MNSLFQQEVYLLLHVRLLTNSTFLLSERGTFYWLLNDSLTVPLHLARSVALSSMYVTSYFPFPSIQQHIQNPLHFARSPAIAAILLRAGADVNAANNLGSVTAMLIIPLN